MPAIPVLKSLRQEDCCKFDTSWGNRIRFLPRNKRLGGTQKAGAGKASVGGQLRYIVSSRVAFAPEMGDWLKNQHRTQRKLAGVSLCQWCELSVLFVGSELSCTLLIIL